jgi:broad specificity phosphatase PhoE
MQKSMTRHVLGLIGAAFAAVLLFVVAAIPAGAVTVTFVRHGQSQGNADDIINTKVPGPNLTDLGWVQARDVAGDLDADPSGIYASTMTRTQQTATPYAARIIYGGVNAENEKKVVIGTAPGSDVVVLNGLQEISAGIFEGSPESSGIGRIGYIVAPLAWTLGLRFVRIPGSEDGNEFDERVDGAIDQMDGDNPVAFSHGATIMFWTLMNVDNPDLTLLLTHQLDNTDVVVVESNGEGGWTLKSWGGENVAPATLPTQLFVNTRDLIVAPQTALYNFGRDASVETGVEGVKDVGQATVKAATDTVRDIGNAVQGGKPNGATDLTAGNKVAPGSRVAAAISRNNDRVNDAVQDVKNDISTSIKKAGEAVKKVAEAAKNASADRARKDAA